MAENGAAKELIQLDDAVELFKKTPPSAASSLLQIDVNAADVRARALDAIHEGQQKHGPSHRLDFVALALHGKGGFDKVTEMIDNLVATLKTEQGDDDKKRRRMVVFACPFSCR